MKTIFVTVGATITFDNLVNRILDKIFLNQLIILGVKKIYIQCGKEYKYKYEDNSIEIIIFPFTNDPLSYISQSDLVISHGGTGSILDTLRLDKPLLVVPNISLKDNHQLDIVHAFKRYILWVYPEDLNTSGLSFIKAYLDGTLKLEKLPYSNLGLIDGIIKELV